MANLRADNLTGTGGRNAIDGSVAFLGDKDALQVPAGSDFAYGTGDFTIEAWIRPQGVTSGEAKGIFCQTQSGNDYVKFFINSDKTVKATFGSDTITGGMVEVESWSHVAVTRASNTVKVFVNGVASSGTSVTTDFTDTTRKPTIGQYTHSFGTLEYYGYISNFHIVKGTALYTTDFTPSTTKLTAVDGTVLLCCQDSDNALQEATGKTITGYGNYYGNTTTNLITNGDFGTGDLTGWTTDQATTSVVSGSARIVPNSSVNGALYQQFTTVAGKQYKATMRVTNTPTHNYARLHLGTGTDIDSANKYLYSGSDVQNVGQGTYSLIFTPTGTTTTLWLEVGGGNQVTTDFDDISVVGHNVGPAPKVLPPVGVDEGVTFEGDTKVNTQSYMYFPTGDTSQRGRGRGVMGGFY